MDQTKLKAFADDKLYVTKMIISVFNRVENILGKGEIARYEQFLLFPQCFQKACFPGASKGVIVWEWVNGLFNLLSMTNMTECCENCKSFLLLE